MALAWGLLGWFGNVDGLLVPSSHRDSDHNVFLELLVALFNMCPQFTR